MILDEYELNPNAVDSFVPEKAQPTWKCGVVNPHKNLRLSYFTRIIGGRPAVKGAWPWQVAVLNKYHVGFIEIKSFIYRPSESFKFLSKSLRSIGSILRRYSGLSEMGPDCRPLHKKTLVRSYR